MFRSDDFGETWDKACDKADLRRRPWYYMHVFADPNDANTVWVANLNLWRSLDGGDTFASIPTPHGDNHALWIDPRNSQAHDRGQRRRRVHHLRRRRTRGRRCSTSRPRSSIT